MGQRRLLALVRGHRMKLLAPADARRGGVPVAARHPRAQPLPPRPSVPPRLRRHGHHEVALRAGRVADRAVRRQLELARPGLVPDQLPADRGAPEVPPLLRRRLPGRDADRLRHAADAPRQVADDLARRLAGLFLRGRGRRRPVFGDRRAAQTDPTGATTSCSTSTSTATRGGVGASHQTGWTALVAKLSTSSGRA